MSMSALDALRQAASALLASAPEPIVRRTLRELLDGESLDAGEHAAPRRERSGPRSGKARIIPKARVVPPDWSDLRRDVRSAMRERDVSFAQVGKQVGFAAATVQTAIGRKVPPSLPLQARLTDWLARAQASEAPFPFRGAAGNGAGAASAA